MRLNQLTFTRFVAAFVVVCFHFIYHQPNLFYPFDIFIVKKLLSAGNLAVVYFFVLSGFIMTVVYYKPSAINEQSSITNFYRLRLARLMPAYLLACLLFIPTFVAYGFPSPVTIILNLLLLHGWFPNHSFNYASWSLTAEVFFYLLFPFIMPKLRNKSLITLSLLVTFGWIAYYLLVQFILPKFDFFLPPIRYLFHFLLGIVAGVLVQPMLAYPGKHFLAAQKWMVVSVIMLIFLVMAQ